MTDVASINKWEVEMKIKFLLLMLVLTSSAHANPNACDDYLSRHYKKDLVLQSANFTNRTLMGDFYFPHQRVVLSIKNSGEVNLNSLPTDDGVYRNIWIKIRGVERKARIKMPIISGQIAKAYLTLPGRALRPCRRETITIDTKHTVGQWGCQVWNNDIKTVVMRTGRFLCRRI